MFLNKRFHGLSPRYIVSEEVWKWQHWKVWENWTRWKQHWFSVESTVFDKKVEFQFSICITHFQKTILMTTARSGRRRRTSADHQDTSSGKTGRKWTKQRGLMETQRDFTKARGRARIISLEDADCSIPAAWNVMQTSFVKCQPLASETQKSKFSFSDLDIFYWGRFFCADQIIITRSGNKAAILSWLYNTGFIYNICAKL